MGFYCISWFKRLVQKTDRQSGHWLRGHFPFEWRPQSTPTSLHTQAPLDFFCMITSAQTFPLYRAGSIEHPGNPYRAGVVRQCDLDGLWSPKWECQWLHKWSKYPGDLQSPLEFACWCWSAMHCPGLFPRICWMCTPGPWEIRWKEELGIPAKFPR